MGPNQLGTGTNQSSRDFARGLGNANDDAVHILSRALGGQGGIDNVFPQLSKINRGEYRVFESEVVKYIKANGEVDIKWKFVYQNGSTRPSGIYYDVYQNGNKVMGEVFNN
ncbi:DNA/RNA non-specific endonuclease [Thorsellia anophelis]|uniref:DNA/RNA non-specific endonuclease n=1 Tax=Thorsellia anophelis TaxID=336804 RepID=UPI003CCBFBDB